MNALLFQNQYRVTMELFRMDRNPKIVVLVLNIRRGFDGPLDRIIRLRGGFESSSQRGQIEPLSSELHQRPRFHTVSMTTGPNCTRKGRGLRDVLVHEKISWKRGCAVTQMVLFKIFISTQNACKCLFILWQIILFLCVLFFVFHLWVSYF